MDNTTEMLTAARPSRRKVLKAGAAALGVAYVAPTIDTVFSGTVLAAASGGCTSITLGDQIALLNGGNVFGVSDGNGHVTVTVPSTYTDNSGDHLFGPFQFTGTTSTGIFVDVTTLQIPSAIPSGDSSQIQLTGLELVKDYYGPGSVGSETVPSSTVTIFPNSNNQFGLVFFFSVPSDLLGFNFTVKMVYDCHYQDLDPAIMTGQARQRGSLLAHTGVQVVIRR
jgi:hypothetical protein